VRSRFVLLRVLASYKAPKCYAFVDELPPELLVQGAGDGPAQAARGGEGRGVTRHRTDWR